MHRGNSDIPIHNNLYNWNINLIKRGDYYNRNKKNTKNTNRIKKITLASPVPGKNKSPYLWKLTVITLSRQTLTFNKIEKNHVQYGKNIVSEYNMKSKFYVPTQNIIFRERIRHGMIVVNRLFKSNHLMIWIQSLHSTHSIPRSKLMVSKKTFKGLLD